MVFHLQINIITYAISVEQKNVALPGLYCIFMKYINLINGILHFIDMIGDVV